MARTELIRWFDDHARSLPWRRTRDPYAIWISEVMLQQTRVETVIPYFERFLARFPDVASLASAPEDAVLSHWSGLGYYRRARQLHAAAKVMQAQHGGRVPEDRAARRALPGIGAYTAGAIGSIAFDLCEPIVDGNVARVLSRIHGLDAPLGTKESEAALWQHAASWAEGPRPGALNQALMELGATVCTPAAPRCGHCPLARRCTALREDRVALLPVPRARKAPKEVTLVAVHARCGERVVLVKSDVALFGGLFGLPSRELAGTSRSAVRAAAEGALADAGLVARGPLTATGELLHVLTHRRLTVKRMSVEVAPPPRRATVRALTDAQLKTVGISTLAKRLLRS